jgi:hypothetical protein
MIRSAMVGPEGSVLGLKRAMSRSSFESDKQPISLQFPRFTKWRGAKLQNAPVFATDFVGLNAHFHAVRNRALPDRATQHTYSFNVLIETKFTCSMVGL